MANWLRQYALSLLVGVLFIFMVGVIAQNKENGQSAGITGFAVSEDTSDQQVVTSGVTRDIKVIVKECRITPERMYAQVGDRVIMSFVVYDPAGRTHEVSISGLDVQARVQGSNIARAVFYPTEEGTFEVEDTYPCKAMGYKTTAQLVVSP